MKCIICDKDLDNKKTLKCQECGAPTYISKYKSLFLWSEVDKNVVKEFHHNYSEMMNEHVDKIHAEESLTKEEENHQIEDDIHETEQTIEQEQITECASKNNFGIWIISGIMIIFISIILSAFTWILPATVWMWGMTIGIIVAMIGLTEKVGILRRHPVITSICSLIVFVYLIPCVAISIDNAPLVEGSTYKLFYNYSDTGNNVTTIYQDDKYYFNIDFLSAIGNYTVNYINEGTDNGYIRYSIENDITLGTGPLGSIFGPKLKKYDAVIGITNDNGISAEIQGYKFDFDELTYVQLDEFLKAFDLRTDNQDNGTWNIVD